MKDFKKRKRITYDILVDGVVVGTACATPYFIAYSSIPLTPDERIHLMLTAKMNLLRLKTL